MFERLKETRGVFGLLALAIAALIFAGTKPKVEFLRTDTDIQYFYDDGSFVTNDYVFISFRSIIIPDTASLYISARELSQTNDSDWVEIVAGTVGEWKQRRLDFENATNYTFVVFSDWTPPPAVHTNGVLNINYIYPEQRITNELHTLPLRTEIVIQGEYESDCKIITPVMERVPEENSGVPDPNHDAPPPSWNPPLPPVKEEAQAPQPPIISE